MIRTLASYELDTCRSYQGNRPLCDISVQLDAFGISIGNKILHYPGCAIPISNCVACWIMNPDNSLQALYYLKTLSNFSLSFLSSSSISVCELILVILYFSAAFLGRPTGFAFLLASCKS